MHIFFRVIIFAKHELCTYLAYIYFREISLGIRLRRTAMPKYDFNNFAKDMPTKCDFNKLLFNLIEITPRHGCSLVNLLHIFKTPFSLHCFLEVLVNFNPLMPGGNKKVTILKQSCIWKLQVCLSMCDLFVTTWH